MPESSSSSGSGDVAPEPFVGDTYESFLASVRERYGSFAEAGEPMFTTDAKDLFEVFLEHLPAELRQIYTCHTCRRFVERFGGLVTISSKGRTASAIWSAEETPEPYRSSVAAMARVVTRAAVTGLFLSAEAEWGRAVTGPWQHLAVAPPKASLFSPSALKTVSGAVAEKRESYALLQQGLADFPEELVVKAQTLLTNGALYRSEKCEGVARWLKDLHAQRRRAKGAVARDNLTWLAVATAPAGFCHVRSTMIGTLLEDLSAGLPFAEVKAKFDAKMHPLQYQRPTAEPRAGNIARAEAIVAELRSAGALDRRFAKLADIQTLWRPAQREAPETGVFGRLKARAKRRPVADMPPVTMTWEKLKRTVLPDAAAIEYSLPQGTCPFYALVTAVHPEAPPIFQWDSLERRNPVSWYTYPSGSSPENWGLRSGSWHRVTAISLMPFTWGGGTFAHQGEGLFFILDGARDRGHKKGAALFPEMLKSEYREIRKTIEAFSQDTTIQGRDEAEACGVCFRKGATQWSAALFRVSPEAGPAVVYRLDRWD